VRPFRVVSGRVFPASNQSLKSKGGSGLPEIGPDGKFIWRTTPHFFSTCAGY
jgi:hypothetical protein